MKKFNRFLAVLLGRKAVFRSLLYQGLPLTFCHLDRHAMSYRLSKSGVLVTSAAKKLQSSAESTHIFCIILSIQICQQLTNQQQWDCIVYSVYRCAARGTSYMGPYLMAPDLRLILCPTFSTCWKNDFIISIIITIKP